ncbi:unnamed protein product [Absidia cylindrospora]
MLVAHSDAVWKESLFNNYGVTYKLPDESWKEIRYQQILNWLPKNLNCGTCGSNQAEQGLCLYIWQGNIRLRCRDCAYRFHTAAPDRHGILFRTNVLQMFCFTCSRLLGEHAAIPVKPTTSTHY